MLSIKENAKLILRMFTGVKADPHSTDYIYLLLTDYPGNLLSRLGRHLQYIGAGWQTGDSSQDLKPVVPARESEWRLGLLI